MRFPIKMGIRSDKRLDQEIQIMTKRAERSKSMRVTFRSKRSRGRPLFYMVALLVPVILTACGGGSAVEEAETFRILNVQVIEVAPESFTSAIRVTGSVEAFYDVTIAAEEGGVVNEILVPRGSNVRRGQAIARLGSEMLEAQLEEARAAADLTREQWERQKALWEEQQIGTELAYLQAQGNARMRAATVSALEARLRKKTIRSPVSGTFEEYYFELGEYAAPALPFARIVSLDRVKITGGVPERFSQDVQGGTPVEVAIDNCPQANCTADIAFVGDTVDPDSRTFTVEIHLPNPEKIMKPGMIANMSIQLEKISEALVVPQQAVLRSEDGYQVFVVENINGRETAISREIQLGPAREDRIVVTEGLTAGERVVIVGQLKLGSGDLVSIVDGNGDYDREEGKK
jgi:RND family efflux transporter MFP subunit